MSDLYERKYLSAVIVSHHVVANTLQVLQNILALGELVEKRPGYTGPSISGGGAPGGHRRSKSFGSSAGIKPWEFDEQIKATANQTADAKQQGAQLEASGAVLPAVKAAAAVPTAVAAPTMSEAEKMAKGSAAIISVASSLPKKKTDERYLYKLLKALVPITKADSYDIDADLRVFKTARVRALHHLLILIGHKDYWNKLELSPLVKCCVEQALTNACTSSIIFARKSVLLAHLHCRRRSPSHHC